MLPKFGKSDPLTVTPRQAAILINLMYVGTGAGALFILAFMNRYGRRTILLASAAPKILAWILLMFAQTVELVYVARFFGGLSHGVIFTLLAMYQCELTSPETRGVVGALLSELINTSVMVMYGLGIWLARPTVSIVALSFQVAFCLGFPLYCPESGYFLVRENRIADAEATLKWMLAKDDVAKELEEVQRVVGLEDGMDVKEMGLKAWVAGVLGRHRPENRRAALVGLILASALTLSGCGPLLAYQHEIYTVANFGAVSPEVSMLTTGFANIIGGLVCLVVIRRLGKRLVMLIAAPLVSGSLIAIAAFFAALEAGQDVDMFRWVPTVFLFVYMFAYGFALYPLVYTYMGEIFSYEMKQFAATAFALYFSVSSVASVEIYEVDLFPSVISGFTDLGFFWYRCCTSTTGSTCPSGVFLS